MLVSSLISSSLRKIGALSSGETIETTRQAEALTALQSMLRSWGAVSANIFATVKESHTLTSGIGAYTWGSGGDISTARPNQITGAYILEGGITTFPVDVVPEGTYMAISVKSTTGIPSSLFFYQSYPLASLYLYPVPDAAYVLYLDSFKPFTETSSFGLVTDTIAFPSYYEEAIIYNLAIRLAPEYGKSVSTEVGAIAKSSFDNLLNANASGRVEQIYIRIPASGSYGAGYSINSDSYR
jgi:hypothetical protein